MKLLHVVPTYAPAWRYGGPIYSVHSLCKSLVELGNAVRVDTTSVDGQGNLDVPVGTPVLRDGVSVQYYPSGFLRRIYWSPQMGAALDRHATDSDLVHAHSVFLWPTWRSARAAQRSNRPLVLSPRGMLVPELISAKNVLVKRAWIALIERRNLAGATIIHVTSKTEAADLERLGLALAPVRIVPNGVDSAVDIETDDQRESDLVLFLGRINWKKGVDRLIRSLTHVSDARLHIAGNDEEQLIPRLQQLARECGVADRVRFLGPVVGDAKKRLLAQATVLVLPSLSENFGNVVTEAMAAGCPVVVTPEVGAADVVRDCDGGLVSSGDPAELGAAVRKLIDDPVAARAMGQRAHRHVKEHLNWRSVAHRMEELYSEAIAIQQARVSAL